VGVAEREAGVTVARAVAAAAAAASTVCVR